MSGDVIPFLGAKSIGSKEKVERKRSPFFSFPEGTRFELVNNELVVSLAPDVSDTVKEGWPRHLRSVALALRLKRLSYRLQGKGGDVDAPEVPDVLRLQLASSVPERKLNE